MTGKEESNGTFIKVFSYILLPLLFLVILTIVILAVLGFNTSDGWLSMAEDIPVVSNVINSEQPEVDVDDLQFELQQVQAQNEDLLAESEVLEEELALAQEENTELNEELNEAESMLQDVLLTEDDRAEQLAELSEIYTGMTASRAAERLEELTIAEAALLLDQMSTDDQSNIMSRMNPTVAATVTAILKDNQPLENQELAAMQERINMFADMLEDEATSTINTQQMVATMKQMPRQAAAQILVNMMESETEFELGLVILSNVSDETRAGLFGEMDSEDANTYIQSLAD